MEKYRCVNNYFGYCTSTPEKKPGPYTYEAPHHVTAHPGVCSKDWKNCANFLLFTVLVPAVDAPAKNRRSTIKI